VAAVSSSIVAGGALLISSLLCTARPALAERAETATAAPTATSLSLGVDLTNDADGDGVYHQVEQRPPATVDVPLRVTISNTSTVAVRVESIVASAPQVTAAAECPSLIGSVLQAGGSLVCRFTVAAGGGDLVATVDATASEATAASNRVTASGSSTARGSGSAAGPTNGAPSPAAPSLPVVSDPGAVTQGGTLPRTGGSRSTALLLLGLFLVGAGLMALGAGLIPASVAFGGRPDR
jgi:LPXTG-motif cell wall-anchored protein